MYGNPSLDVDLAQMVLCAACGKVFVGGLFCRPEEVTRINPKKAIVEERHICTGRLISSVGKKQQGLVLSSLVRHAVQGVSDQGRVKSCIQLMITALCAVVSEQAFELVTQ